MVVTDFDGTIYSRKGSIHPRDLRTLTELEAGEIIRVIATGRSMESLYRVMDPAFPVDYVVFSSGAGVFDLKRQKLLRRTVFSAAETGRICGRLMELKIDFMVHHPIPDNHFFHYFQHGGENPDFVHRLDLYRDYAMDFDWNEIQKLEATQFVVIMPPQEDFYEVLEEEFRDVSIIWSTSPLDHASRWIELFPEGAHKGTGVAWLAEELRIPSEKVMVVGNDFNDIHMLEWSVNSFVVENAPEELKSRFENVAGVEKGGFSMAVERWLQRLKTMDEGA